MTTFFDTSALFAVLNDQEPHHEWSKATLIERKVHGPVVICDAVFSEFSVGMPTLETVRLAVGQLSLERYDNADEMLFRAGKAFLEYRKTHNGQKTNVLSDFLIGAAAEVAGVPLVTTESSGFSTYFPNIKIIKP